MADTGPSSIELPLASTDEVCRALSRILRIGDDAHRCFAAEALGRIGSAASLDPLVECLRDEDEDVRAQAVESLALIGDRSAGPALLENLTHDPSGVVKVKAVIALGRLAEPTAVPILRELVRERSKMVAWDDEEFLSDGWDYWLDVQVKAIEALAEMQIEDAVPDIVFAIDDEMGQNLDVVAFKALARLGSPGVAELAARLQAGDPRLRRLAAAALCGAGSEAARSVLSACLADPSAEVRLAAVQALAGDDVPDDRLHPLFDDPDPSVRAELVRTLGARHPDRLETLIDDPDDTVQAEALKVVFDARTVAPTEEFVHRLRVKLRGPSEDVAAVVAVGLADLAPETALADLSEQVSDKSCPVAVRCAAAHGLGRLGSRDAVRSLAGVLDNPERRLRLDAMIALAASAQSGDGSQWAREALLLALRGMLIAPPEIDPEAAESHDDSSRSQSSPQPGAAARDGGTVDADGEPEIGAVEDAWPKSTLEVLTAAAGSAASPASRPVAVAGEPLPTGEVADDLTPEDLHFIDLAEKMPRRSRPAIDPEIPIYDDVRRFAARVLGDVAGADVVTALTAALADRDVELKRNAADSIARLAAQAGTLPADSAQVLADRLTDMDRDVRLAIVRALAYAAPAVAVESVTRALGDADGAVRAAALRSLSRLGGGGADVDDRLGDEEPEVRLAAAECIARRPGPGAAEALVDFTFGHGGYQRRDGARLLRSAGLADAASGRLLAVLGDEGRRRNWRIAIEALAELHRSDASAAAGSTSGDMES